MVTRHYQNFLRTILQSSSQGRGWLPLRDVNGKIWYSSGNFPNAYPYSPTLNTTLDKTAAGISVGTGTAAATEFDYNLKATITSGIAMSTTYKRTLIDGDGNYYLEFEVTVTNNKTTDLTISEIGYKQTFNGIKYPGSNPSSAANIVCLIDRTVLSTPMTLTPGSAGVITYRMTTVPETPRTVAGLTMASFAWGTDEQIAAMIDAAQAGTIDLQTDAGWQVGEMRSISLAAFTGYNGTNAAQTVHIAISSFSDYNNCGCVLQFDFVDILNTKFPMNGSNSTTGGYGASKMYTTTLPALVEALPTWLKTRLKTFDVLASAGGSTVSTIETVSNNKLALRSEIEVRGTTSYGQAGEGSWIPYYYSEQSRKKSLVNNTTGADWWLRSAYDSSKYVYASASGTSSGNNTATCTTIGLAPFGCV